MFASEWNWNSKCSANKMNISNIDFSKLWTWNLSSLLVYRLARFNECNETWTLERVQIGGETNYGFGYLIRRYLAFDVTPKVQPRSTRTDTALSTDLRRKKSKIVSIVLDCVKCKFLLNEETITHKMMHRDIDLIDGKSKDEFCTNLDH